MSTPLVYGSHPEPTVAVRSIANGSVLAVRASHAASMVVSGDVELVGELDDATRAVFDAAVSAQLAVHATARARGAT